MHEDQLDISEDQVALLLADELPEWAGERVERLVGTGTVNAIFRVGDQLTARFPLRPEDPGVLRAVLEREARSAYELSLVSPFPTSQPLHIGRPGHGFPLPWSVQSWLEGLTPTPTSCARALDLAGDLLLLIGALREADTRGRRFTGTGRGGELSDHDAWVERCLQESAALVDITALRALWHTFRTLPREDADVMSHTDLIPGNLLTDDNRLVGVLDGGGFQAADPALDLVCAWHLFDPEAREVLRQGLSCPDLQWERGKAWAFEQAMGVVWYYVDTNPQMAEMGRTTLERLLRDA